MTKDTVMAVCRAMGLDEETAEEHHKLLGILTQLGYGVRAGFVASVLLCIGRAMRVIAIPGWTCAIPFLASLLVLLLAAVVLGLMVIRRVRAKHEAAAVQHAEHMSSTVNVSERSKRKLDGSV